VPLPELLLLLLLLLHSSNGLFPLPELAYSFDLGSSSDENLSVMP